MTNNSLSFTYSMAEKISWNGYGTKLRHCHPVYFNRGQTASSMLAIIMTFSLAFSFSHFRLHDSCIFSFTWSKCGIMTTVFGFNNAAQRFCSWAAPGPPGRTYRECPPMSLMC